MDESLFNAEFTHLEWLQIDRALLQKWSEFLFEAIDRDIERYESLEFFEQTYIRAFWRGRTRALFDVTQAEQVPVPATTIDELDKQVATIVEHLGVPLTFAGKCVSVVRNRLESAKRLVGDRFAKRFRELVNTHEISSPIEQLFLLEWQYAGLESRLNVDIEPQAEVKTSAGTYHVDFLITSKTMGELETAIVIELDGHEFHEKNKEQVARDNKRTRALTQAGMTVLRFSGHELMGKSRDWMGDVIAMIEKSRATAS